MINSYWQSLIWENLDFKSSVPQETAEINDVSLWLDSGLLLHEFVDSRQPYFLLPHERRKYLSHYLLSWLREYV